MKAIPVLFSTSPSAFGKNRIALTLGACLILAACGDDASDAFGYGKSAPDEFTVISRPPLILPPDYNLRPPGSGTTRTAIPKPTEVAKILVLGKDAVTAEKNTAAEDKLLENAATAQPTGDSIRETIENERTGTVSKNPDLTETLTKDQK
ncbi:MAG: DUF3035 domain-containing protein [Pseudomonadota bacterium]|nr:DUF3035 domain-containing protein [Pseudomonadota bacterium]